MANPYLKDNPEHTQEFFAEQKYPTSTIAESLQIPPAPKLKYNSKAGSIIAGGNVFSSMEDGIRIAQKQVHNRKMKKEFENILAKGERGVKLVYDDAVKTFGEEIKMWIPPQELSYDMATGQFKPYQYYQSMTTGIGKYLEQKAVSDKKAKELKIQEGQTKQAQIMSQAPRGTIYEDIAPKVFSAAPGVQLRPDVQSSMNKYPSSADILKQKNASETNEWYKHQMIALRYQTMAMQEEKDGAARAEKRRIIDKQVGDYQLQASKAKEALKKVLNPDPTIDPNSFEMIVPEVDHKAKVLLENKIELLNSLANKQEWSKLGTLKKGQTLKFSGLADDAETEAPNPIQAPGPGANAGVPQPSAPIPFDPNNPEHEKVLNAIKAKTTDRTAAIEMLKQAGYIVR